MIGVSGQQWRVVAAGTLGEEFGVVVVGTRWPVLAVREGFWFYVNVVEGHLALVGQSELDDPFDLSMDGLILTNDNILACLPLESPLPGDDVIRVNLLITEYFHSAWRYAYPSRRPAESLVFCVEEACILEARK